MKNIKQNIVMAIILIFLFVFGLLIYDFSDKLDDNISNNNWYRLENNKMTVVNFKNEKFSYLYDENKEELEEFKECKDFRYNKSINIVKLNCKIKKNKIYLSSVDDKKLSLTLNGEPKTFYITKDDAIKYDFIEKNKLDEEQFQDLINTSLSDFDLINYQDLIKMYKEKETNLIAYITEELTIQNALNLKALYKFIDHTNKTVYILNMDKLDEEQIKELNKIIEIDTLIENKLINIPIYIVGNKKCEFMTGIEVNAVNELKELDKEKEQNNEDF